MTFEIASLENLPEKIRKTGTVMAENLHQVPERKYADDRLSRKIKLLHDVSVRFADLYRGAELKNAGRMKQLATFLCEENDLCEIKFLLQTLHDDFEDYLLRRQTGVWRNNDPFAAEFHRRDISVPSEFKRYVEYMMLQPELRIYNRSCPLKAAVAANAAILLALECMMLIETCLYLSNGDER